MKPEPLSILAIGVSLASSAFLIWFEVHYKRHREVNAALAVIELTLTWYKDRLKRIEDAHPRQSEVPSSDLPEEQVILQLADTLRVVWGTRGRHGRSELFQWYESAVMLCAHRDKNVPVQMVRDMETTTTTCLQKITTRSVP